MHLDRRTFVASLFASGIAVRAAALLQTRLTEAMAGRQGSAVVLDVVSGRVLSEHRLAAAAKRLVPPGSVIKPFVLSALLEASVVSASTRHDCRRTLRINQRKLDCSHGDLGEALDAVSALCYSCNSYFAQYVVRLDPQSLIQTLTAFGLTSSTTLAPSEAIGRISIPRNRAELQLLALGEGGVQVTPLEIAGAYRRLALLKRDRNARADRLGLVFSGLEAAAQYGTARLARPSTIPVAGKTGTAAERAGARPHAWFAGYAPANRPEIVVVIFLETGSGGGDAAPVAGQVFAAL